MGACARRCGRRSRAKMRASVEHETPRVPATLNPPAGVGCSGSSTSDLVSLSKDLYGLVLPAGTRQPLTAQGVQELVDLLVATAPDFRGEGVYVRAEDLEMNLRYVVVVRLCGGRRPLLRRNLFRVGWCRPHRIRARRRSRLAARRRRWRLWRRRGRRRHAAVQHHAPRIPCLREGHRVDPEAKNHRRPLPDPRLHEHGTPPPPLLPRGASASPAERTTSGSTPAWSPAGRERTVAPSRRGGAPPGSPAPILALRSASRFPPGDRFGWPHRRQSTSTSPPAAPPSLRLQLRRAGIAARRRRLRAAAHGVVAAPRANTRAVLSDSRAPRHSSFPVCRSTCARSITNRGRLRPLGSPSVQEDRPRLHVGGERS